MKKILFTLMFVSSTLVVAQYDNAKNEVFEVENYGKISNEKFNSERHKYLANEKMIGDFDEKLGIIGDAHYSGLDKSRLSFSYHFSHDFNDFGQVSSIEGQFYRKLSKFDDMWWALQLERTTADFAAITQNRKKNSGSSENSEENIQRGNDDKQTLMMLGLGMSYRFRLMLDIIPTDKNYFETCSVFFNYVTHNDSSIKKEYKGYGLTMEYGVHNRVGTSFFYGGKLSYNITSTVRQQLGNESYEDRTLTTGWADLAFELGYYY